MPATSGHFETWNPPEFGMTRAAGASLILVLMITAFCYWASVMLAPKPQLQPIQVTQAQLTQLPAPTPPPPPKVIPPPKPLPAVIPKPPPIASKIVVATKPPPPVHHIFKPVPHPVVHHAAPPVPITHPTSPAPTAAPAHSAPAPTAPAPPSNGIPIYGQQMHALLQNNVHIPPALASVGASGTSLVAITVAPDGHVISAKILRSGGNPLIDQTAIQDALGSHYPPFAADMPQKALTFTVEIEIDGSAGGDSDSDSDSD